jgi:hypothetical protein
VQIFTGGSLVARTDAAGRAQLDVGGAEGSTYELEVRCPSGYRSPAPLAIRQLTIGAVAAPEYAVTCRSTRHTLVVAVRTSGQPGVPVLYYNKQVAQTDRSGVAHVMFEMDVHERVELTLSTAGKEADKLHPKNPTTSFEVEGRDEVQFFDVAFTRDPKKKAPPPAAKRAPVQL